MKFLVLLLATAALASASLVGRKAVDVKEDGTIFIRGENGRQIVISKQYGPYGQKDIEIEVTGPNTVTKKIQINDNNQINIEKGVEYQIPATYDDIQTFQEDRYKRSSLVESQNDILYNIFREYQGVVDEQSYQQLLSQVQKAVLQGKISSNVLNFLQALNEDSNRNVLTSGQGNSYNGVYGQNIYRQQSQLGQLLNKYYGQQKYGQQKYGQGVYQGLYQGIYGNQVFNGQQGIYNQDSQQQFRNVLVRIFNQQVLFNYLNQQGILDQSVFGQVSIETVLENFLHNQGIFDKAVLVELINNPVYRNFLVEQGVFNQTILDQLLNIFNAQGVYDRVLLEQLVNKHFLKSLLVKQGIFQNYIVGQTVVRNVLANGLYNKETYGQEQLVQFVKNQFFRNLLVQQGVFNKYALQQFLYVLNTQGVYSQVIAHQLVNKQALKYALIQQGIYDESILGQLVYNEILGLNVLFNIQSYQQTPNQSYRQLIAPEYAFDQVRGFPYGQDFVGINIEKTIVRPAGQEIPAFYGNQRDQYPTESSLLNTLFYGNTNNYNKINKMNYLRSIYGQQQGFFGQQQGFTGQQGYTAGSNQGYYYPYQGNQGYYAQYQAAQQQQLY